MVIYFLQVLKFTPKQLDKSSSSDCKIITSIATNQCSEIFDPLYHSEGKYFKTNSEPLSASFGF